MAVDEESRPVARRELLGLVHLLTDDELVSILGYSDGEFDEVARQAACELRRRSPERHLDLWRQLLRGTAPQSVQGEAIFALANIPGAWPYADSETGQYVRGDHGDQFRRASARGIACPLPDPDTVEHRECTHTPPRQLELPSLDRSSAQPCSPANVRPRYHRGGLRDRFRRDV